MAEKISPKVDATVFGFAAIRALSSSVNGNSGTRVIDHKIVEIERNAPIQNDTNVNVGI